MILHEPIISIRLSPMHLTAGLSFNMRTSSKGLFCGDGDGDGDG